MTHSWVGNFGSEKTTEANETESMSRWKWAADFGESIRRVELEIVAINLIAVKASEPGDICAILWIM